MEKTVLLVEDERGLVASLTEEFQFETIRSLQLTTAKKPLTRFTTT